MFRAFRFYWPKGALLLCSVAPAWAQSNDLLQFDASYSVQQDSNLFRLPSNTNFPASVGKSSAEEVIKVSTLGVGLNTQIGLQQFELNLSVLDNKYQNFSYLNYTGTNYSAAWHWSVTPRVHGNLTTARQETLNSDFQGSQQKNLRTVVNTRLDGVYEIDGVWRLLGGLSRADQNNQQPILAGGDFKSTGAEAGVRHDFTTGSTVSYVVRQSDGQYLNRPASAIAFLDDQYKQIDNELRMHMALTGKSSADISAAQFKRTNPNFPERNYDGYNASANLNLLLTGKSQVVAGAARELANYQSTDFNFTRTDRVYLTPVWQIGAKSQIRFNAEIAVRDYLGTPTVATTVSRQDITHDTGVSFNWQVNQHANLNASVQNAIRSSNISNQDYASTTVSVSAHFNF